MSHRWIWLLLSLALSFAAPAHAQFSRVMVEAGFEPAAAAPGDEVVLRVVCEIELGYHIYGAANPDSPTGLFVTAPPGLEAIGQPDIPKGTPHKSYGVTNYWIESTATLTQRFRVTDAAPNGALSVKGVVDYMACTPEFCDPAAQEEFVAELTVSGSRAAPAAPVDPPAAEDPGSEATPVEAGATPGGEATTEAPPSNGAPSATPVVLRQPTHSIGDGSEGSGSLWSLILLCIGGGMVALIMPCTYPMIPITFSFFTKQADARGGKVLPLALTYGAGIVVIFIGIGLLVGPIIIQFAGHWITNLAIGGAFVLFAFALFGWINLQPPRFLMNAAGQASHAGGLLGVFLMGATLVVTSFTCTAPIVGSLLAGVARGGVSQLEVAIGMGVFGLTMATPFVFLALLPGRVKQMPKSGEWMNTLKVSLGFIELAAALKFFSNADIVLDLQLIPREVFLFAWAFLFTLLALFLFGFFRGRGEPSPGVSPARNSFGIAVLALSFYCVGGASGLPLGFVMTAFEPNYQLRPIDEHEIVKDDYLAAAELARNQKKYLLVNFTGFN